MAAFFLIILILCYQPNAKIYIFDRYGKLWGNKAVASHCTCGYGRESYVALITKWSNK